MMRKLLLFAFLFSSPTFLFAQDSKVMDNLSMKSRLLKGNRKYAIYLPPGYESSERSYPVLYLLHGAGDDQTGWLQFGEVQHIADQSIKAGDATPMIIVMPDANTGQRGYFNSVNGDWRYEDFFFEEFIPFIEKTYRIKGEKQFRAVAGLSMGGGGSFVYALRHPELFSSACPLSAAMGPLTLEQTEAYVKRIRNVVVTATPAELETYYKRNNVLSLLESLPAEQKKAIRWYIDCGDDDFLYEGNSLIHIAMRKKEIPHEYRVRDGGHSWPYWRSALPNVLEFVSDGFHRN